MKLLILDTETTGFLPQTCELLEIGWAMYETGPFGGHVHGGWQVVQAFASENAARDVNHIPMELVHLHGERPGWDELHARVRQCDALVSHNAQFDAQWVPSWVTAGRPWVCTVRDWPWPDAAGESRVAPWARACDDPRAQRYASAIEAPETVFPCGSTREAMRALHEEHEAVRALERARRAAGSREARAAASTLPIRADTPSGGPQRRRSAEEIERQKGLRVRHAQERLRSVRRPLETRVVDERGRRRNGGHADALPLRTVYQSLFGPTSRLPAAIREALGACTGDPILRLAEVEAHALVDSALADRMAYAIVARYPIWHLSLRANRRAALYAHLARPSRGDVVDEPPPERTAAFLALFERALRAVPSGGWPALAHAVAGVKAIPDLLERIVRIMPDAEFPSFARWMRRLHPCHVAHGRLDEGVSARVAAMSGSLVAAHRAWLTTWAGEVESSVLRGALAARLMGRDDRERALRQLVDLYRWTQRQARRLTGSPVVLEFVADESLGRAWIAERRIAVNVRPLLEGVPEGRELVEAIVLHELGHIAWHRDALSRHVWGEAVDVRIQKELNIVLDEQLERRLRALDPRWGEQLHRLTAWVFGTRVAPASVTSLWQVLGPQALDPRIVAWATARRRACGDPRSLLVCRSDLARALRLLGCDDDSLSAFLRALRMGLGRQRMGQRGRRAVELFDRTLVDAPPGDAFRRAGDLHEIFLTDPWPDGGASERRRGGVPWDAPIGAPDDLNPTTDAGPWGEGASSLGGISGQEVEVLVRRADARTSAAVGHAPGGAQGVRLLNDSASLDVPPLEVAPHVRADPSAEAALLAQVAPQGRRLAQSLARLGSRTVMQSGRVAGTLVDAGSAARRVSQRDPRMLTRRVHVRAPEFFLGLCVDASGSMRIHGRLERARQMAAMLWSAARTLPGSICEVYSFNHDEIRPAFAGGETAFTRIVPGGGNNDAAALRYVAQRAEQQRRRVSLLVMLSDGSPTACSVQALRNEATRLQREGYVVAQLSFRRGAPTVVPHQVEVDERREHDALQRFERFVSHLAATAC